MTFFITLWSRPLAFWPHFLGTAIAAVMDYIWAKIGVVSSSRFPFSTQTHQQTDRQSHRREWSAYTRLGYPATGVRKQNTGQSYDMHTHAVPMPIPQTIHKMFAFVNLMTLTFDFLTWESMHAESLPCTISLLSLLLIAQAVFLSERGQSDRQTGTKSQTPLITLTTRVTSAWINTVFPLEKTSFYISSVFHEKCGFSCILHFGTF